MRIAVRPGPTRSADRDAGPLIAYSQRVLGGGAQGPALIRRPPRRRMPMFSAPLSVYLADDARTRERLAPRQINRRSPAKEPTAPH